MSYEIELDGRRVKIKTPPIESEDQYNKVLEERRTFLRKRRKFRGKASFVTLSEDDLLELGGFYFRIEEYKAKHNVS